MFKRKFRVSGIPETRFLCFRDPETSFRDLETCFGYLRTLFRDPETCFRNPETRFYFYSVPKTRSYCFRTLKNFFKGFWSVFPSPEIQCFNFWVPETEALRNANLEFQKEKMCSSFEMQISNLKHWSWNVPKKKRTEVHSIFNCPQLLKWKNDEWIMINTRQMNARNLSNVARAVLT